MYMYIYIYMYTCIYIYICVYEPEQELGRVDGPEQSDGALDRSDDYFIS